MPEIRTDWLTGRTVIVAENRALRPNEFESPSSATSATPVCPFCPGQESLTPPATLTLADDAGRWRIRVVPNKYPALSLEDAAIGESSQPAIGAHELVIESPRHVERMSELSEAELADALAGYRARLAHWHDTGRFRYGLVFKNQGPRAGASLAHVHSQLVALPQLPPAVAAEYERANQFHQEHERCAYCQLIENERAAGVRVVWDGDGFVAFCPPASLQPHEVWLLPAEHEPWFERRADSAGDRLAAVLHALLVRIERIVPRAAYNMLLRTAPWHDSATGAGHWRIEILPRANALAGFELATAIHINPLSPARAAQQLKLS